MKQLLKSRRGEGTYIDTAVFVLIAVMFVSFALNLFSVISVKQQMDVCADQLVRQIQYSGEVGADTDTLFTMVCGTMDIVENPAYTVDTTYFSGRKIQLGTPFRVEVTGRVYLGGFGDIPLFPIDLVSAAAGVSEEYWK